MTKSITIKVKNIQELKQLHIVIVV